MTLPIYQVSGTPRDMGRQFGEACRASARELLELRLAGAAGHAAERGRRHHSRADILALCQSFLPLVEKWHPDTAEENRGIAEGTGLSEAEIFALQGLTDLRDLLTWGPPPDGLGCTSLLVSPARSKNHQALFAQTWDLAADNRDHTCLLLRRPQKGPATLALTVSGALSMIGLNAFGFACGTNNLKAKDARPGLHYLHLLHRCLNDSRDVASAAKLIETAPRLAAHAYHLCDASGSILALECSALECRPWLPEAEAVLHCNHFLHPDLIPLEAEASGPSSKARQRRGQELCASGNFDVASLRTLLADRDGGDLAINRRSPLAITTNACVILEPVERRLHACRGPADEGEWVTLSL